MDYDDEARSSRRDTYLVIVLCLLVGVPLFLFFNILTFGLFILLFLMATFVAALAVVNYFLWGRSFTQETAWEREEAELADEAEVEEWLQDEPGEGPR
jgi:fatty acid desaturase